MKYTKFYTVKEWKKFDKAAERENGIDISMQEILLKKYNVILTDHMTRKEKVKAQRQKLKKKLTIKNIQKATKAVSNGINSFSRQMDGFHLYDGPKKDYSVLMGKPPKSFRL